MAFSSETRHQTAIWTSSLMGGETSRRASLQAEHSDSLGKQLEQNWVKFPARKKTSQSTLPWPYFTDENTKVQRRGDRAGIGTIVSWLQSQVLSTQPGSIIPSVNVYNGMCWALLLGPFTHITQSAFPIHLTSVYWAPTVCRGWTPC